MFIRFIAASWKQAQDLMDTVSPKHEPGTPFSANPDQIDAKAVGECITLLRKAAGAAAFLSGTLMYRVLEVAGGSLPTYDPQVPLRRFIMCWILKFSTVYSCLSGSRVAIALAHIRSCGRELRPQPAKSSSFNRSLAKSTRCIPAGRKAG
jgi:hypothetical protein